MQREGKPNVFVLKKIYGLQKSPRRWYKRVDYYITTKGFQRCDFDPYVYVKVGPHRAKVFLLLYVDNMLITSVNITEVSG